MNNIAIIYKSRYGNTKKYAQWIAEETKSDVFELSEINVDQLMKYETIVYGGGIYAGGIAGIHFIAKNFDKLKNKKIIVFTVGLTPIDKKEVFLPIIEKNFSEEMRNTIRIFHFRGGLDPQTLGFLHKSMLKVAKTIQSLKKSQKLSDADRKLIDTTGKKIDFTSKASIAPLILALKE